MVNYFRSNTRRDGQQDCRTGGPSAAYAGASPGADGVEQQAVTIRDAVTSLGADAVGSTRNQS